MLNCSVLSSPQSHPSVTQAKAQTHKNKTNWYKTRSSKNLFKPDNFAQIDLYTALQLRLLFEKNHKHKQTNRHLMPIFGDNQKHLEALKDPENLI